MEHKIKKLMDECMSIKHVRMSTGDPIWMTPLVKSLFRVKSRISLNNEERLRLTTEFQKSLVKIEETLG